MHPQQCLLASHLREAVEALLEAGFVFVSASQVAAGLHPTRRYCVITFDDGYRNNLEAMSLLQKYRIPAIAFVVPDHIESGKSFWWDAVYRKGAAIGKSPREIESFIEAVKLLPSDEIPKCLMTAGLSERDFIPSGDLDRPLSREELADLARSPGIEIGNHTWGHEILTRCTLDACEQSLSRAQKYFQEVCGRMPVWLAYPNGNCNDAIVQTASTLGFQWGVTLESSSEALPLPIGLKRLKLRRHFLRGDKNIRAQCNRFNLSVSIASSGSKLKRRFSFLRTPGAWSKQKEIPITRLNYSNWLRPRLCFVYPRTVGHSGQSQASEMVIADMRQRGWHCDYVTTPGIDHAKNLLSEALMSSARLFLGWFLILRSVGTSGTILHINLGQTGTGLLRDGLCLFFAVGADWRRPVVLSLHGSWFMSWETDWWKSRWLALLAREAHAITVLGPDQLEKLTQFGVARSRIAVMDNSCEYCSISEREAVIKQRHSGVLQVLFLSSLIDTKGYPEFLEGLLLYACGKDPVPLDAVLCGRISIATHSVRYTSVNSAETYIAMMMDRIKATGIVTIRWLRGAEGAEKLGLFRKADIFVLPTHLDAQPIVLLEALASGCAIITSKVGQIPQTLGAETAILLDEPSPEHIATALSELSVNPARRQSMAVAGVRRFLGRFTRERHAQQWDQLFTDAMAATAQSNSVSRRPIWFACPNSRRISGLREATRLIQENIDKFRWRSRWIDMPALDRDREVTILGLLDYLFKGLVAVASYGSICLVDRPVLHVTLGQTRAAMLRDGLPYLLTTGWRRRPLGIFSLHGSLFTKWQKRSVEALWLRLLVRRGQFLTVLGERQQRHACSLGVPKEKVVILHNTCDTRGMEFDEIKVKQQQRQIVQVLHLSNLIDSKGYPEYLEALEILNRKPGQSIEAVLCGKITMSEFSTRFSSENQARTWIESKIVAINQGPRVRIRWIEGAFGAEKWRLYREAQIFVLPTRYAVEAQPLVLLEAMAFGCAIVSSSVGEIAEMLAPDSACLLDNVTSELVAQSANELVQNHCLRNAFALAARRQFSKEFSGDKYAQQWESLFAKVCAQ
jgi:glycosyltransferase involved in cell wall biosynthesis/peptidoglycan/xylan/chitin deacetylase (PgdA/CDA1 family)